MAVDIVTFSGKTVTSQDDALVYESALGAGGLIYGGTVTIKSSSVLHITAGHGVLCGRKFTITESDISVQLPTSGTQNGRLYLHLDLSNTSNPITLLTQIASTLTPPVQQSDINIINGVYEIDIATFRASASTLSNVQMVAPIIAPGAPAFIANVEQGATSTHAYTTGQYLMYKGKVYRATTTIAVGASLTPGSNMEEVLLADELFTVDSSLNGFGFGVNAQGKAGYILPGTSTIVPFKQATGTATAAQVLAGYTFSNDTVQGADGSMPNRGSVTLKPTGNNTVSGQAGYYESVTADGTASYSAGYTSGNTAGYNTGYAAGKTAASNFVAGNIVCNKTTFGDPSTIDYTASTKCLAFVALHYSEGGWGTVTNTGCTSLGDGVYIMNKGNKLSVYATTNSQAYASAYGRLIVVQLNT